MNVHRHHRKLRSQGGVTLEFHDYIHKHPAESYRNPAEIPVTPHPELRVDLEEAA